MNAFPSPRDPKTGSDDKGMTLRDYFAAKAMQGLFSHKPWNIVYTPEDLAKESYQMADAMLKARGL
jgi:hypothetical protein